MLKIENVEIAGWEAAIRGMRNPKNSWERSDSYEGCESGLCNECAKRPEGTCEYFPSGEYIIGPNDHELMMNLAKGGPVHAKYRRMIVVWLDITAPLYLWKEFDTYKVGTVANSCSTMHKIQDKEFTLEDFSCEHLINEQSEDSAEIVTWDIDNFTAKEGLQLIIELLNRYRWCFLETKDKKYWWQMIQLLPGSYNQKRTIELNYEVLHHIYHDRRFHKLDEWHVVCDWIESLPHSEIITQKVVVIE